MTKLATQYEGMRGAWKEYGTLVLDPASIAANSQGITTATVTGAKVGDGIFVNPRGLDNKLAFAGAKVTSTDTVSIYLNNVVDATTAVDAVSNTWDYMIIHYS